MVGHTDVQSGQSVQIVIAYEGNLAELLWLAV